MRISYIFDTSYSIISLVVMLQSEAHCPRYSVPVYDSWSIGVIIVHLCAGTAIREFDKRVGPVCFKYSQPIAIECHGATKTASC